jgi:signal transducing adaptor molecule
MNRTADLVSMNESFVKARTIFDRIMEDSLARHTASKQDSYLLLPNLIVFCSVRFWSASGTALRIRL